MKLKELRTMIAGNVVLCEESEEHRNDYPDYINVFEGDCRHISQELFERDIVVISGVNKLGEACLEILLEHEVRGRP